jgi:hypothetical protein
MTAGSVTFWARRFLVLQVAIAGGLDIPVSLDTQDGDDHPHTTAARRLPAVHPDTARALTIEELCRPVLGYISFDFYKYVTDRFQFEKFWRFLIP